MFSMKSIQSKIITVTMLFSAFIAVTLIVISVASISILSNRDSNQLLEHLGRENVTSINLMLTSTEHSVKNIYYYAYDQLESLFGKLYSQSFREEYLDKVGQLSISEAKGNPYIRAFYYHLTEQIKDDPHGFYYRKEDSGYKKLASMDPALFTDDSQESLSWYYLPQKAKKGMWVGPYNEASVDTRVISYVEPVYIYGRFAGVIGMDIDIDVVCQELQKITVYNTGSAVMFDIEDNILYEKDHESGLVQSSFGAAEKALLDATHEALNSSHPVEYLGDNGRMKLFALKLSNDMTLCITAPLKEINSTRRRLMFFSVLISLLILVFALLVVYFVVRNFLRPLNDLTEASKKLADGNFDVTLSYNKDDEVGQLSKTFEVMSASIKRYYDHFHSLAYTDSMTGLNNKAAFDTARNVIESELRMKRASFTIVVMDVNNLKKINDSIGHEKGDLLLKHAALCMRQTFIGFPLYRIGGDEFCTILNNSNPQVLIEQLQATTAEMSRKDFSIFNCNYQIAAGSATYTRESDKTFNDVFNRADKAMYENKKILKAQEKKT